MMRHICLSSLFLLLFTTAKAQYYYLSGGDTSAVRFDSVMIVPDEYKGDLVWQRSVDSIQWEDMRTVTDTLILRLDETAFYRAEITEPDCNPFHTAPFEIMEKKGAPQDGQFSVDHRAQIIELDDGIKIKMPANALESNSILQINTFDSLSVQKHYPNAAAYNKRFITAFDFGSDSIAVCGPIRVVIPTSDLDSYDFPKIFLWNREHERWENYLGSTLRSVSGEYLEITLTELTAVWVEVLPQFLLNYPLQNNQRDDRSLKIDFADEDCFDLIRITLESGDFFTQDGNESCFYISDGGSIEFLNCPDEPIHMWTSYEFGENCVPACESILSGSGFLKVGGTTQLTVHTFVESGGQKVLLAGQSVALTLPDGLSTQTPIGITGEDGKVSFDLVATGKNLNAVVDVAVKFDYCPASISASAGGLEETACQREHIRIDQNKLLSLQIYDDCTSPEEFECGQSTVPDCELVRSELAVKIEADESVITIGVGEKYSIDTRALNLKGEVISDFSEIWKWESADPEIATVIDGVIKGIKRGITMITVRACDLQYSLEVTVGTNYLLIFENKLSWEYAEKRAGEGGTFYDYFSSGTDFIFGEFRFFKAPGGSPQLVSSNAYVLLDWITDRSRADRCPDGSAVISSEVFHEEVTERYDDVKIALTISDDAEPCTASLTLISLHDYMGRYKGNYTGTTCSGQSYQTPYDDFYDNYDYSFDGGSNTLNLSSVDCVNFYGEKSITAFYDEEYTITSGGTFSATLKVVE